jgi:putative transposase
MLPPSVGTHGCASWPRHEVVPHPQSPLRRPARSLGSLVAGYKAATTKRINDLCGTHGKAFWQRNYYEHIIRNDADLDRIRLYIANNPAKWAEDEHNPDR